MTRAVPPDPMSSSSLQILHPSISLLRCPLPDWATLREPEHPLALPASVFPAAHGTPAVCSASPHLQCLLPLFQTLAWGRSP